MAADDLVPLGEEEGRIGGRKLSETGGNSTRENPDRTGVQGSVPPPSPGWGPGGRRFKSCLPDYKIPADRNLPKSGQSGKRALGATKGRQTQAPRARRIAELRIPRGERRRFGGLGAKVEMRPVPGNV